MKRIVVILILAIAAAGVFWRYPLFHFVRLDTLQAAKQRAAFDAAACVKEFWNQKLVPSFDNAQDASSLLANLESVTQNSARPISTAFGQNAPKMARGHMGRRVGVGRTTLFYLRGQGTIVQVDKKGVGVSLKEDGAKPDIVLHTGLLFGNVARDATGLLDASDYPNSQQFNEISTELNRTIETRVIPVLKEGAATGKTVQFVGCAEVSDTASQVRPLAVIPLEVRFE